MHSKTSRNLKLESKQNISRKLEEFIIRVKAKSLPTELAVGDECKCRGLAWNGSQGYLMEERQTHPSSHVLS